jgi:hypothetical protein
MIQKNENICCSEIKFLFRQIQLLLEEHASVIHEGQKRPFNEINLKLSQDILEDIKGLFIQFFKNKDMKYLF